MDEGEWERGQGKVRWEREQGMEDRKGVKADLRKVIAEHTIFPISFNCNTSRHDTYTKCDYIF